MKTRLALLATAISAVLFGQAVTSLTGTVSDPTAAVVPKASITIVNEATHATRSTLSDSAGRYSFLQVEPGTYTVTAKGADNEEDKGTVTVSVLR